MFEQQCNWSEILIGDIVGLEAFLSTAAQNTFVFPYFEVWPRFWFMVGQRYIQVKDYRCAMTAYSNAAVRHPNSASALHALAYCQIKCRYYPLAITTLTQVIKMAPNVDSVYLDLTELHILTANYEAASSILNERRIGTDSPYYIIKASLDYFLNSLRSPNDMIAVPSELSDLIDDHSVNHQWCFQDMRRYVVANGKLTSASKKNLLHTISMLSSKEIDIEEQTE